MVIKEITGEQLVNGRYLLVENQLRTAKNGSQFLALKIADRTGQLPVKVWSANEQLYAVLEIGRIIELQNVQAKCFKDQVQLEWDGKNSNAFKILSGEGTDYSEFFTPIPGDLKKYWDYIIEIIDSLQDSLLCDILQVFFDDRKFVADFLRVPAALKRHHVYIGGLLEHTAGVTALSAAAAGYYPLVDRDLLLTGAILHDVGKVQTYQIANGFDGTDEGKLIGHLVLGVQMVEQAFAKVNYPNDEHSREIHNKLIHLLVSHHGIMEWGSPIEPLIIEACILHHADNMDAQTTKFLTIVRENQSKSEWAPFDTGLGRSIYLGKQLINESHRDVSEGSISDMELRELVVVAMALVTGWLIQNIVRWKPLWNVGVTFLGILILPPTWSIGLTAGLWLGCAFMTYRPRLGYQNEIPRGLVWAFIYAIFTFSGFILTLLLMWKVKAYSGLPLVLRHEVGAWLYFATIEVCFYRIIARNYPKRKRFVTGYEIGFFNMLMALYWVYSYGLEIVALTFMTLLVINPLLLLWLDRPMHPTSGIPLGGDQ